MFGIGYLFKVYKRSFFINITFFAFLNSFILLWMFLHLWFNT